MTKLVDLNAVLPCDVFVAPATIIRKGCPVSALMLALEQRVGKDIPSFEGKPLPTHTAQGESEAVGKLGGDVNGAWHDCECKDCVARRATAPSPAMPLDAVAIVEGRLADAPFASADNDGDFLAGKIAAFSEILASLKPAGDAK